MNLIKHRRNALVLAILFLIVLLVAVLYFFKFYSSPPSLPPVASSTSTALPSSRNAPPAEVDSEMLAASPAFSEYASRIHGRVVLQTGEIAAGARMSVQSCNSTSRQETVSVFSDGAGLYSFTGLRPGRYLVLAQLEQLGGYGVVGIIGRFQAELDIMLYSGGSTEGHVFDEEGAPVSAARVAPIALDYFSLETETSNGLAVWTDDSGYFQFPFLPENTWQLAAQALEKAPGVSDFVPAGTKDVVIILRPGLSISGRVVDAMTESGVSGMELIVLQNQQQINAQTDTAGRFLLTGLALGEISVTARHPLYSLATTPATLLVSPEAATGEILLRAIPLGTVKGRVVTNSGTTGVQGLRVSLAASTPVTSVSTDDEGYYIFRSVPAGPCTVSTRVSPTTPKFDLEAGATHEVTDITVEGSLLRGQVLDEEGKGVGGAKVKVSSARLLSDVMTEDDGSFLFAGKEIEGRVQLLASTSTKSSALVEIMAEEALGQIITLTLDRVRGIVAGQVVDRRGRPLPANMIFSNYESSIPLQGVDGATRDLLKVSAEVLSTSDQIATDVTVSTDLEGRFAAVLDSPGNYTIYAVPRMGPPSFQKKNPLQEIQLQQGATVSNLRLILDLPEETIKGRVLDGAGNPLEGISVSASDGSSGGGIIISNKLGEFTFEYLAPGVYDISVRRSEYGSVRAEAVPTGTTDLELRLEKAPEMEGRVLDASTRTPITYFEIALLAASAATTAGVPLQTISSPQGMFKIQPTSFSPNEPLDIYVQAAGYAPARTSAGNQGEAINVLMEPSDLSLEGFVADQEGMPIAEARLQVQLPDSANPMEGQQFIATSDGAGHFLFPSMPEEAVAIVASHPDYAKQTTAVDPRVDTSVTIVLEQAGGIEGTVLLQGQPASGAVVSIPALRTGFQITGPDAKFTFGQLPAGAVEIYVQLPLPGGEMGESILTYAEVIPGETVNLNVEVE